MLLFPRYADLNEMRVGPDKVMVHPERMLCALRMNLKWIPSVKGGMAHTLKGYRAGMATEMAANGDSMDKIRRSGGWKSKTGPQPCVYMDQADEAQHLNLMVHKAMRDEEDAVCVEGCA
jgi:hypothetical protein